MSLLNSSSGNIYNFSIQFPALTTHLHFTFICFQNGKVVFPQVLKTSSDINEIKTPFLIKGTKSWYFSLCFFFSFFKIITKQLNQKPY